MTIKGETICSLIQTFPILLILAQNHNRCLKTPLVYKPPSPTPSPDFIEAYNALFHTLYGEHDCHGYDKKSSKHFSHSDPCHDYNTFYNYGHPQHNVHYSYSNTHGVNYNPHQGSDHQHGYDVHGYGYGNPLDFGHETPNKYGHGNHHSYGHGYPNYKKVYKVYNVSNGHKVNYPVINQRNRVKIVVRKNKIGRKKKEKLQEIVEDNSKENNDSTYKNLELGVKRPTQGYHSRSEDQSDFWLNRRYQNPFSLDGPMSYSNNQRYRQPSYRENQYRSSYGYYNDNGYGRGQHYQQSGIINPNNGFSFPSQNNGYGRPSYGGYRSNSNYYPNKNYNTNDQNLGEDTSQTNEYNNQDYKDTPENTNTQPNNNNEQNIQTQYESNNENAREIPDEHVFPEVTSETAPVVSIEFVPGIPIEDLKPIQPESPETEKPAELTPVFNTNPEQPVFSANPGSTDVKYPVGEQTNTEDIDTPTGFDRRFNAPAAFDSVTSNPFKEITPLPRTDGQAFFRTFDEPCSTPDGNQGQCKTFQSCPTYVALLKNSPSNPQVRSLLRKVHCGFDGNSPKVCCPDTNGIPKTPPPFTTTTTTPRPTTTLATFTTLAPIFEPTNGQVLPEPPVCGYSNSSLSRVVGGVDAKLGDFPWMALLGYKGKGEPRWLCGGSLITSKHVLSAAHCIHGHENSLYTVRLGELDLAREDEGATPIDIPIKTKIKHEEYNPKAFTTDIGILVLENQVQFTPLISPVCLPMTSELRARSFENYRPFIAGWGDTQYRGESATHLQVLTLPVVPNESCMKTYARYKAQVIDERVLCAGYQRGGKDACQGDSGGPLFQPVWNKTSMVSYFYQIGVVSFGRKCAEPGFPGVYTRVTHFMPWIENTVRENS